MLHSLEGFTAKLYNFILRASGAHEHCPSRSIWEPTTTRFDHGEWFSPVMPLALLRILLAPVAFYDLKLIQFNITLAYLHGTFEE